MSDGHLNKCKECSKHDIRKYRRENDSVREYDRQRYYDNSQRKLNIRDNVIEWRLRNPLGYKAHMIVNNAVRDGRLVKEACKICGDISSHAHHNDYTKPLEVEWFCALHHSHIHNPEI